MNKPFRIATCSIEAWKANNNMNRSALFRQVLESIKEKADMVLFPAGFFTDDYKDNSFIETYVGMIREELIMLSSDIVVCIGLDMREGMDQLGYAVSRTGVLGAGRKFFPTSGEYGEIQVADDYLAKENGFERVFTVGGKRFYIAICYDAYGIRKRALANPDVDFILNLVHRFKQKGEPGSGEVYCAKYGFAGSSKQWGCPTFGAAVFERCSIPKSWPSGVMWNQGEKSVQLWKYSDNPMSAEGELHMKGKHADALVRFFAL